MTRHAAVDKFERLRRLHLDYMRECWRDCVKLADEEISHRSEDPADEDVRRGHVFELAQLFFTCHALKIDEFAALPHALTKIGRGWK